MKVLVTGGLGFVGCAVVHALLQRSDRSAEITILDDFSTGNVDRLTIDETKAHLVTILRGDICSRTDVENAAVGKDIIIHLAAQTSVPESVANPANDFQANIVGLFNILDVARCQPVSPKIIFASSNAALGDVPLPATENSLPKPLSPYGASKLCGETFLAAFGRSYGLNSVSLRFGNVYGPGNFHNQNVISKFIRQALEGEDWKIYGDGSDTRDYVYLSDLTDAIEAAIDLPVHGGELFQISTGQETTIRELVANLQQAFETKGLQRPTYKFEEARAGDVARNCSDISRAREILGWEPKTSLEKGLKETLDWFVGFVQR